MEDIILGFWKCSLKSDFSEFDWDEAFDTYEPFLAENCIAHGQGTFEEFKDHMDQYHGLDSMSCDIPHWATYTNQDWGLFDDYDVMLVLVEAKYNFMRDNFSQHIHGDLAELRERINNRGRMSESELISLFDECIHAQHATGNILDDVDIESLREQAEEEYEKEKERFPTNIRDFLVQY